LLFQRGDADMKGWFDAFRNDGGPTLYSYSNRTPVTGDVQTLTLYLIFFTVFLAFLVIFPGVRKEVSHCSVYLLYCAHEAPFAFTAWRRNNI
jgi:dual oxidase maturation factor 1